MKLRCISAGGIAFDSTRDFPEGMAYHQRVSQTCFRFFDGSMHYTPSELAILIRSLPTDTPCKRRLFFMALHACRRRVAKRWQETSLAKLFYEADQYSWLFHRSLAVRLRCVAAEHGLCGHDLFVLADNDSDGVLGLGEVAALLDWATKSSGTNVTKEEVISFVLSLGPEPRVSYPAFIELISQADALAAEALTATHTVNEAIDDSEMAPATESVAAAGGLVQLKPKNEPSLQATLVRYHAQTNLLVQTVEKAERALLDVSRAQMSTLMAAFEVDWMMECADRVRDGGPVQNPHVTLSACYYDWRGAGQPAWTTVHGVAKLGVLTGSARIRCAKGQGSPAISLRVPFSKNGGGATLNQYTITMTLKLNAIEQRCIISTASDSTKCVLGAAHNASGLFRLVNDGGSRGHIAWANSQVVPDAPTILAGRWCTISLVVDAPDGTIKCFIDGKLASASHYQAGSMTDGNFSLQNQFVLFASDASHHAV
eukprot:4176129-Prymnesium_polylepis.1